MCVSACDGQKKVSEPLNLILQEVVSYQMWVLGTELWALARAASAPHC